MDQGFSTAAADMADKKAALIASGATQLEQIDAMQEERANAKVRALEGAHIIRIAVEVIRRAVAMMIHARVSSYWI